MRLVGSIRPWSTIRRTTIDSSLVRTVHGPYFGAEQDETYYPKLRVCRFGSFVIFDEWSVLEALLWSSGCVNSVAVVAPLSWVGSACALGSVEYISSEGGFDVC